MKQYPRVVGDDITGHTTTLQFISRERQNDVAEFNNLQNILIRGRKVDKIPSGSADVNANDRLGDCNFTADYFYVLIDNAGTAEWRRTALASW